MDALKPTIYVLQVRDLRDPCPHASPALQRRQQSIVGKNAGLESNYLVPIPSWQVTCACASCASVSPFCKDGWMLTLTSQTYCWDVIQANRRHMQSVITVKTQELLLS